MRGETGKYRLPTSRMDHTAAYLMILPAVIIMTIFCYVPLYNSLSKCLTDWTFYKEIKYVGMRNFELALKNEGFLQSLKNVSFFVVTLVPVQVILAFLFAQTIKNMIHGGSSFIKTAIYVPSVISGIVASIMFSGLFNFQGGLINYFLIKLGVGRVAFFTSVPLARLTIIVVSIWMGVGNMSLIMYAGLMNIPVNYYEAAEIDGASAWKRLIYITIPSMKNIFLLVIVQMIIGVIQMFDTVYQLTGGGPFGKTTTPMLYVYNTFTSSTETMGYTIACSLIVMVVVVFCNCIVFRLIQSEKSMDE